ncbi:MAG: two-component system response regulator [Nitrospirae bacterium RIFCSPLOWO2_02_FULL_62_14]|nr:MAG: two-component system response regulator [Nitrospirae bacterium RIFCSPLOWO2_02_FULL_62_14]OGW69396.1 MAG: two-component system response regulator [Nitrospirae bacterium RIFCSPLOWO2_01_FULL_62_17]OGX04338.1 MAG: two-component system response regulator [Nitrospirae bacterium RIFCSPLOWO2_12_FULL_63_8]
MGMWPFGHHDPSRASMGRVLIVDDEENIRRVARLTLTKAGYEVIEGKDGADAIEALNSGENPLLVDVIICDIRMPKINGVEAISYFRSQYPSVPIIVQTGFPDLNLATSLMKQGVSDYLVKPVENEKLIAAVAKAVEGREMFTT